ncbi:MAG: Rab family GTPase [Promethearchaeota archaeon]
MKSIDSSCITGVIYTELNEELGPKPIYWAPAILDPRITMHVGIKGITMLAAEQGLIPKNSVILPFPSLNLKGMIKFLEWEDQKRRGSVGLATITFLFREADDMIFYKYFKEIDSKFDSAAEILTEMERNKRDEAIIGQELQHLCESIESILDQFKLAEKTNIESPVVHPEQLKENPDIYQFKLIIIGDPHVGKTSLILRYINKVFDRTYLPTLGVNVSSKTLQVGDSLVQLVIWDIAGQAKFEYMRSAFYKGAKCVFYVFDLTNSYSFNSITKWSQDIQSNVAQYNSLMGFVIGNKSDLTNKRVISREQAIHLAKQLDLEYFETSALTGDNVKVVFNSIAAKLLVLNR